jgi:hypothetical protein
LAILITVEVIRILDAKVRIQNSVFAIRSKVFDQMGLKIQTGRLVEFVIQDNLHSFEVLLARAVQVLEQPGCGVHCLANVDFTG